MSFHVGLKALKYTYKPFMVYSSKTYKYAIPAKVDTENRVIQEVLLQYSLHYSGGTTNRQARISQSQYTIKWRIVEVTTGFCNGQSKFLICDGKSLNLGNAKCNKIIYKL